MAFLRNLYFRFLEKRICAKEKYPSVVCEYISHNKNFTVHPEVARNRYIVIDTETIGLNYKKDMVIAFGGIGITNLEIDVSDSYEAILQSEKAGDNHSISIHGIRNSDVRSGVDRREFFVKLLSFLRGDIIVGHHVKFDILMLSENLAKIYPLKILNPSLDIFDLAIYLEQDVKIEEITFQHLENSAYTLDSLLERYNVRASGRHTAIGDAYITAELFLKLIHKLVKKKGIDISRFLK